VVVDVEEGVAEEVLLPLDAVEEVADADPPVDAFVEVPAFAVVAADEVAGGAAVVAAAAGVDEDDAAGAAAEVAAAPVPVDVKTAGLREPTLSLETQVPATLLLMS